MIKVLGDQVPVVFPETPVDITLLLDITKQNWEQIKLLSPTHTYIITTKPLEQCQEYIALGFYNIVFSVIPKTVTKLFILNFLNTQYEDNRIKLVVDNLIPLYKQYGNTIGCITELLRSIKTCNLETYRRLVKYNIGPMMDMLDKLGTMFVLADTLSGNAKSLQDMQMEVANSRAKVAEFNLLQTKLAAVMTEYTDMQHNLSILQQKHNELQDRLAKSNEKDVISSADVHENPIYLGVVEEVQRLTIELTELHSAYSRLQITAGIVTNDTGDIEDPKDRLIANLKAEINGYRELDYAETLGKKLPSVTDAMSMRAETILYLKEIKPQIYINAMVFWINMYLARAFKPEKKTFLILIFDPLTNEYQRTKYLKRNWAINDVPNQSNPVVVTNEVSLGFLKDRLKIDQYDFLVVIDRLGNMRDIFENSKTQKFYLITTVNDIVDYKLDRNRCVGFFDQEDNQFVKYHIAPHDEGQGLTTANSSQRAYKIYKDKVFLRILVELGVVKNA